jgi:hypothetical protein
MQFVFLSALYSAVKKYFRPIKNNSPNFKTVYKSRMMLMEIVVRKVHFQGCFVFFSIKRAGQKSLSKREGHI